MKVPVKWLRDLVEIDLPPDQLAHRLTMAGLEAEQIEQIGAGWDLVYVGDVERVEPHPDADRLMLATVVAGEHRLTVVTGAPNIAAGQKVALALAGARLLDGYSDTPRYKTLKPGTIRGVRSEGMVCSEKELGLSGEHEGIMVLEADAPTGAPLADWLGDTVIEFEITPNLVHAFSMVGIAREVAALTDSPLHSPAEADLGEPSLRDDRLVQIDVPDLCPRCTATVIEGVSVDPSPGWLRRRLIAAGLRPINNIVDITNYVMLEYGQPLHAYDRTRLAGGRIVVRRAALNETLETLDHIDRTLDPEMMVIADGERAVGVAGVMGGVHSEVDESTTTILLEAANFDMKSVRHTARALRLRTDASARFERGLDPNLALAAAARATQLILDICPGSRVTAVADAYPGPVEPTPLSLPFGEIERLLGVRYKPEQVLDVLSRLDFAPRLDGDTLTVTVPTYRRDVLLPADVVEEVARIIGYDSLPETLPSGRAVEVWRDPNEELHGRVRRLLAAAGCSEAITYIATSADHLRLLGPSEASAGFLHAVEPERALTLRNPLQSDRATLRTTALAGLLETTAANLKHETGVRLFEIGRAYLPTTPNDLPNEANIATIVLAGRREPLSRFTGTGQMDYFDLKGIIDALLGALAIADVTYERTDHAALHPGRAAVICRGDRRLGLIGEVRPDRAAAFGIEGVRTVVAELDLDLVLDSLPASSETITVPKFLPVEQDFAVIVSTETPATAVEAAILAGAGSLASGIALFDVYEGEQIGAGRRSLAYRVTFTAPDRALTDDDLPKVRSRIERAVKQRVDGQLRA